MRGGESVRELERCRYLRVCVWMSVSACMQVTTKTTPDPQLCSKFAPLYIALSRICPNGSLFPSKVKAAILEMIKQNQIIFNQEEWGTPEAFATDLGGHLRTMFAKYRELRGYPEKLEGFARKVPEF